MALGWLDIIPAHGVVGVLGKRGEGKTAVAYFLAELRHERLGIGAVVFGPGLAMQEALPPWVEVVTDLGHFARARDKTLLLDEGSLPLHARESLRKDHVTFDKLISLSRQRGQFILYVTHHSRKLDPLEVIDWDVILYKQPSKMHVLMERQEIRLLSGRARDALVRVSAADRKRWSYVFYDDMDQEALMENPLPTFWSDQLSIAVSLAQDEEDGEQEGVEDQETALRRIFAQACGVAVAAMHTPRSLELHTWLNQLEDVLKLVEGGHIMTVGEQQVLILGAAGNPELAGVVKELARCRA